MEDLLQFLYLVPVGLAKFAADGSVDLMNPAAAALLQSISPSDTLENIYTALMPLSADLRQRVARFSGPAGSIVDQQWLRTPAGGASKVLSLSVNQIKQDVYMAVLSDVTRLAEQERQLHVDREKFTAIFDHIRDYAIYTVTLDGVVEDWNQSIERYAGWQADDVQGRSMEVFFRPKSPDQDGVDVLLDEARRVGSTETEGWRLKRDGVMLWDDTVITALPDETGTVRGFVVVSRDLTERKRQEDHMKRLATVDPLTGAYNRRQGDAFLEAEFSRRKRNGRSFALMLLDVDHFKAVNDRFGHPAGDAVLCSIVQLCESVLRSSDLVVRWGGEEFLVLMPDSSLTGAQATAERLRVAVEAAEVTAPGGETIRVTVSIGVAVPTSNSPAELLSRADVALYAAKTGGRNRMIVAP